MLTQNPKIPAWIDAEIKFLIALTEAHNLEKLRERRANPKGVQVQIYHHSKGTDSYFCDVHKSYITWKQLNEEANQKVAYGQLGTPVVYLYTAIIEYKEGVHFVSTLTKSKIKLN